MKDQKLKKLIYLPEQGNTCRNFYVAGVLHTRTRDTVGLSLQDYTSKLKVLLHFQRNTPGVILAITQITQHPQGGP